MRRVIIVCAGGQGVVVADVLQCARAAGSEVMPIGFVDDTPALQRHDVLGLPVLGPIASLSDHAHDGIVVALGNNRLRRALTDRLLDAGEQVERAIHPNAYVAASATIGDGAMVSCGAVVLPRATVGRGCIINTRASVDHDSVVGDFAHIAPAATLGGNVRIGAEVLVAIGATVASGSTVGARSVIGAGAAVVRHIPEDVVAWGVPARVVPRPVEASDGRR